MKASNAMKKALIAMILVLMVASFASERTFARKGKLNIKGEVKAIDGGALTIESNKGETFVIAIPEGLDISDIQVGDSVLVKATAAEDDSWVAVSIKKVGPRSEDDDEVEKPEGFRVNSAFCAEGKQDKPHPLAPKIAQRYGVSEEWVMEKFCEGYSIGAIMLAIKTSQIEGMIATPDELLANRAAGTGWGLIWKELGLIGSEKNGHSPPGLLKKPDHAGPNK
jgi:hypothetical protein